MLPTTDLFQLKLLLMLDVCWDLFDDRNTEECSDNWVQRYYFDHKTLTCEEFWYGQCESNSRNIFTDLPSCEWLCEIQPMYLSKSCLEPFDPVFKDQCQGGNWRLRYFYDKTSRKCAGFWYDGCKSNNQNLFADQRTCEYLCESPALQAQHRKTKIRHGAMKGFQYVGPSTRHRYTVSPKDEGNDTFPQLDIDIHGDAANLTSEILKYEVDPCDSNPCENGATCGSDGVRATCTCVPGTKGDNCSVVIGDPCKSAPCLNGGTCNPTVGRDGFWCQCPKTPKFFSGLHCEMELSVTLPTPTKEEQKAEDTKQAAIAEKKQIAAAEAESRRRRQQEADEAQRLLEEAIERNRTLAEALLNATRSPASSLTPTSYLFIPLFAARLF